ncbi:MAG: FAD-dependent oxidoreductase [Bdellovibrio sp.]|nr:FAD-dependent oxidoreductase [Bdellovibrio sp.]
MRPIEYQCTVTSFRWLTPTVFETTFEPQKPLEFKAGQFVSIVIPGAGPGGRDLRRAYSIASPPETRPVELCIKIVEDGPGTNYLAKLRPGDTFRAFAPYGDFVYKPKPGKNVCFIATGTGIAPFRSMVLSEHFSAHLPAQTLCLLGVRKEDELLYLDAFDSVAGVKFVPTITQPSPEWTGFKGRVTDYLRSLGADFNWVGTDYYLCGNGAMITEIKTLLAEKGVQKDSIHQEIYYR